MDIKNLTTFIHVAELGSFTKAAEVLGFSQSTVSFQIKQLENELDAQLFERINRTVSLTEKGRQALGYAHQIIRLSQGMEDSVHTSRAAAGPVRLAMADSLCDSLLAGGFPEFQMQYPGVFLKIITAGTEEMFRLIDHNEADAILTLDTHIYNTSYVIVREKEVGAHFIAGRNSPLWDRERISPQELTQQPFLLTERWMSYRRLMEERLAGMSLEIRPCLEIGSADLICQLVSQGEALGFLPDYVTARARAAGQIRWLPVEGLKIRLWKQLLYHKDKWVSPPIQAVLDFCVQREFAEDSPASCQSLSCSAGISRMNASSSREAPFTPTTAEDT